MISHNSSITKATAFVVFILSFLFSAHSQTSYKTEFESFNRAFEPINLDSSQRITPADTFWRGLQDSTIQLDFPFDWGPHTFNSITVSFNGGLIFQDYICDMGFTLITQLEWDINDPSYAKYPPFSRSDSAHGGVFKHTTGSVGNRKTTLEWYNATSNREQVIDTINFQIILYESESRVEYHFGDLNVDSTTWSTINWHFEPSFTFTSTPDCDNELNSEIGILYNGGTKPDIMYFPWNELLEYLEDSLIMTIPEC